MKNLYSAIFAGLSSALAIGILTFLDSNQSDYLLIMAPFGATAVLVFGVPASPLAQPKNVIFGHLITAIVGLTFISFVGVTPLTLALATGLGVSAMLLSKTTHPPAGGKSVTHYDDRAKLEFFDHTSAHWRCYHSIVRNVDDSCA